MTRKFASEMFDRARDDLQRMDRDGIVELRHFDADAKNLDYYVAVHSRVGLKGLEPWRTDLVTRVMITLGNLVWLQGLVGGVFEVIEEGKGVGWIEVGSRHRES